MLPMLLQRDVMLPMLLQRDVMLPMLLQRDVMLPLLLQRDVVMCVNHYQVKLHIPFELMVEIKTRVPF